MRARPVFAVAVTVATLAGVAAAEQGQEPRLRRLHRPPAPVEPVMDPIPPDPTVAAAHRERRRRRLSTRTVPGSPTDASTGAAPHHRRRGRAPGRRGLGDESPDLLGCRSQFRLLLGRQRRRVRPHDVCQQVRRPLDPLQVRVAGAAVVVHPVDPDGVPLLHDEFDRVLGRHGVEHRRLHRPAGEDVARHPQDLLAVDHPRLPRRALRQQLADLPLLVDLHAEREEPVVVAEARLAVLQRLVRLVVIDQPPAGPLDPGEGEPGEGVVTRYRSSHKPGNAL